MLHGVALHASQQGVGKVHGAGGAGAGRAAFGTFAHLLDADYGKSEDAKMSRSIAIAVLMVAVAVPAFACEWNKSAATDSRSTVASHSGEQAPHGRS
jgi:hypothetical protein